MVLPTLLPRVSLPAYADLVPHVRVREVDSGHRRMTWQWGPAPLPKTQPSTSARLWQPWPGRGWPLSSEEERQFRNDLEDSGPAKKRKLSRPAITTLLGGLRGGLCLAELLRAAPGADPGELRHAYARLETLRSDAVASWEAIAQDPTVATLRAYAATASRLLGVPVRRLAPPMEVITDDLVAHRLSRVLAEIERAGARAHEVEQALSHFQVPSLEADELSRVLYDPYRPSLWGDPHFVPTRVGALTPVRVASLLDEHQDNKSAP